MQSTEEDVVFGTLMALREAEGYGDATITAVLCVARNNAVKKNISLYQEVAATKFRYSSMNCPVNVADYVKEGKLTALQQIIDGLSRYPTQPSVDWDGWNHIKGIVAGVLSGAVQDITNGATLYYSTLMDSTCPFDQSKVVFTTEIGHQKFYREL